MIDKLNYIEIEPERLRFDAITVLFLHEALGSIGQWKSFPQDVCDELGLKGIVYDRQGHGQSSGFTKERDERYLHEYALEELPVFIDSTIPSSTKILLIGHSDGGTISLLYGSKYPERITGIVTMAAHVINEPETIAGIQPAVEAYQLGKLDGLRKYHGEKTDDLFYAWADIWRDKRFLEWNIVKEIGADIPSLFIQGQDDQYGTVKQLELLESRFINGSSLLLEVCGHHPHLEKKKEVIAAIKAFYQREIA